MELMAEILQRQYQEPDDAVDFGLESGESGGDRADYDDVDDYDGWDSSPPELGDGTEIAGLTDWRRAVSVTWVQHDDHNSTQASETGIKKIVVTAWWKELQAATVTALRSHDGDAVIVDPGSPVVKSRLIQELN
jgi:hypothetical protein